MKYQSKRLLSLWLSLVMLFSLLSGLSLLPVQAATVNYVTSGNYVYNWGEREELATFLSPMAEEFYVDNNVTYGELAAYAGASSTSDVPYSALFGELHELMYGNLDSPTSYGGTRELYRYTDCQNSALTDDTISSFYSGESIGPDWDSGKTWNREHVWPNSKSNTESGDDYSPRETDIMMLRPTTVSENSSRGNTPYGEGSGYYDPNEVSDGVHNVRGDVSRVILYVYTCWGGSSKSEEQDGALNYIWDVMQSKDVLLKWMEEDPVDTWEMGRNDSVEAITGTRNVFVDYPELAFALFNEEVPADYESPSGEGTTAGYTVTASTSNSNYGTVSVNGNVITATPKTGYEATGYTILSGSATVVRTGNTFKVSPASDVSVCINFAPRAQVSVQFSQMGTIAATQTAYMGDAITLPNYSGDVPDGYTFIGWSEQTVEETTIKPAVLAAGSAYTVGAGAVLYAVYSRFDGEDGGNSDTYELYSGTITEGDYVIVYDKDDYKNQAMIAEDTGATRLNFTDITYVDGNVDAPDALAVWHIAYNGSYWTLYNEATGTYAGGTGTKNKATVLTSVTDYAKWTVTGDGTYEFVNVGNKAKSVNANLRRNTSYGFACYSTSTGGALTLYKRQSGTVYYSTDAEVVCTTHTYSNACDADCDLCGAIREVGEHTYDDDYDADCNACGAIREVNYNLFSFGGFSASEDVRGVAFEYTVAAKGITLHNYEGDYAAATISPNEHQQDVKLVMLGAVVSNKADASLTLDNLQETVIDIPAVYFFGVDTDGATYAVRVIDIPEGQENTLIHARPYYIYEDADGNSIVCYGSVKSTSYAEIIG